MKLFALLLVLLASPALAECDCMWYAYTALKRIDVKLRTFPAVTQSTEHGKHGYYLRGVVGVPDVNECKAMVHEFVHHYQYERYGEVPVGRPDTKILWDLNEREAEEKTARARNLAGECR